MDYALYTVNSHQAGPGPTPSVTMLPEVHVYVTPGLGLAGVQAAAQAMASAGVTCYVLPIEPVPTS